MSPDVCPWNARFAADLPNESPLAPRAVLAGKESRTLARQLLRMSQPEFSAAFKGSPMKQAKRRGLARNARRRVRQPVAEPTSSKAKDSGQADSDTDVAALQSALGQDEPLVREHAARALASISARP